MSLPIESTNKTSFYSKNLPEKIDRLPHSTHGRVIKRPQQRHDQDVVAFMVRNLKYVDDRDTMVVRHKFKLALGKILKDGDFFGTFSLPNRLER